MRKSIIILLMFCAVTAAYSQSTEQDTLEFKMPWWDFKGDCGNDCYKFIGMGTVTKINGQKTDNLCIALFVKCPTHDMLYANNAYVYLASEFTPNECSTGIDTCSENKYYYLTKSLTFR